MDLGNLLLLVPIVFGVLVLVLFLIILRVTLPEARRKVAEDFEKQRAQRDAADPDAPEKASPTE